jgi:hypothetical protein
MAQIVYHGVKMTPEWRDKLITSQSVRHYTAQGKPYARIPYGDDNPRWGEVPCQCGALKGELHVTGECQFESCPVCRGHQLGDCDCVLDEFHEGEPAARRRSSGLEDKILVAVLVGILVLCVAATVWTALTMS